MDILLVIYGFICAVVGAGIIHTRNAEATVPIVSRYAAGRPVVLVGVAVTLIGIAIVGWGMSNVFMDLPEILKIG